MREGSKGVSEQRVYAKRMRLLDTGLSARSVKRKPDYVKIITHTRGNKKIFTRFSKIFKNASTYI